MGVISLNHGLSVASGTERGGEMLLALLFRATFPCPLVSLALSQPPLSPGNGASRLQGKWRSHDRASFPELCPIPFLSWLEVSAFNQQCPEVGSWVSAPLKPPTVAADVHPSLYWWNRTTPGMWCMVEGSWITLVQTMNVCPL